MRHTQQLQLLSLSQRPFKSIFLIPSLPGMTQVLKKKCSCESEIISFHLLIGEKKIHPFSWDQIMLWQAQIFRVFCFSFGATTDNAGGQIQRG